MIQSESLLTLYSGLASSNYTDYTENTFHSFQKTGWWLLWSSWYVSAGTLSQSTEWPNKKMLKRPLAKFQNKIMSTQTLYQRSGIFTCANTFIQLTKSMRQFHSSPSEKNKAIISRTRVPGILTKVSILQDTPVLKRTTSQWVK